MIETFDYGILQWFQQIHNDFLTETYRFFTIIGEGGAVWIAVAILLLCFRETRKHGVIVAFSLILCLVFGNGLLKNIVARPRPCWRHPEVEMLIGIPTDYSFPSGHTFSSFAAALSLFHWKKSVGFGAFCVAVLIATSRLYFFVHYPTDILAGIMLGTVLACISIYVVKYAIPKKMRGSRI
nr:phosphatase PAP2 family protein [Eubacterium sp.]